LPTPVAIELLGRYVARSQRLRRSGVLLALVLALSASIVLGTVDPARTANGLDLVRLATIGLAGSLTGAIAAEAFRLRRPAGARSAGLELRRVDDYADPAAQRREHLVLAAAGVGVLGGVASGTAVGAAAWGAVVALVAVARRWAIGRIATRPRPAIAPHVAEADDRVRRLAAGEGVSRPASCLSALLVAAQFGGLGEPLRSAGALVAAGWTVAAVVWWWRGRTLGLSPIEQDAIGGTRSHLVGWMVAVLGLVLLSALLVVAARG
jgi:hypothetical protein